MSGLISRTRSGWSIVTCLISRDLKVRYQSSMLGAVWCVMHPLFHLLVFTVIFKVIMNVPLNRFSSYAFIGILAYSWLHSSLSQAAGCVVNNRQLVSRPRAPTNLLPLASVGVNLLNFAIAFPILVIFLWVERTKPGWTLVLLPAVLLVQGLFTLTWAYLSAAVNVFMRDTEHVLEIVLRMGYFLSPVFYSVDQVPGRWRQYYFLNPMVHFLDAYRSILLENRVPNMLPLCVLLVGSVAGLALSVWIFRRLEGRFVDDL